MDDDNKIIRLRKGFVTEVKELPEVQQADPNIVRYLEMLLEDAKAGDIRALAVVALKEPDVMKCWYHCKSPFSNALLGGAQRLVWRITEALDQDED